MGNNGSKARERTKQVQMEQETARLRIEAQKKQQELAHQQQLAEIQRKNEQHRRQHEQKMKELENLRLQKNKELKIKQKNEAIAGCQQRLTEYKGYQDVSKQEYAKANEQYQILKPEYDAITDKINAFENYRTNKLKVHKDKLTKAEEEHKFLDDEINSAISKTKVHKSNVYKFLILTKGLLNATLANQEQNNKMVADINTFSDLIERDCNDKLTIKTYFNDQGLGHIVRYLENESMINMEDIIADDEDEYKEVIDIVTEGLKNDHDEWQKKKNDNPNISDVEPFKQLTLGQKKKLKKFCKQSDKTWKTEQISKIESVKEQLNVISVPLAKFFGNMNLTAKDAQSILSYGQSLSDIQKKAIQNCIHGGVQEPERNATILDEHDDIKLDSVNDDYKNDCPCVDECDDVDDGDDGDDSDDGDDGNDCADVDDCDDMDDCDNNTPTQPVVVEDENNNNNNDIDSKDESKDESKIELSKDDELAVVLRQDKSAQQCIALNKAAIMSIHVVESMSDDFDDTPVQQKAKGLAITVQSNCIEILKSQGQVRTSVQLAQGILDLKPANIDGEAAKLWKSVDNGVNNIYNNALNMIKVSVQFFSYFVKFKQGFLHYLTNKDKSLLISLEYLRNDIKDFTLFKQKLNKTLIKLDDTARECIKDCIENSIGAQSYSNALQKIKIARREYLERKAEYDTEDSILTQEKDKLIDKQVQIDGQMNSKKAQMEYCQKDIEMNQKNIDDLNARIDQLNDIQI